MPKAQHRIGIRKIRLASIVGSVERCGHYTRGFLPLNDSDQQRWIGIKTALRQSKPLPPIRVFQVGEGYFVADGNHRVSVLRQQGLTHIEAYVVEIQTKVPLSPEDQSHELRLKGEYGRFLEHTSLDEIRPEAHLRLTVPGRYEAFQAQIEAHRAFMALDQRREVATAAGAADWYDTIYQPVVKQIRDRDLLQDFPGWTEADLYLALCEHQIALEEAVGQQIELQSAAADLARQIRPQKQGVRAQLGQALSGVLQRWIT